jgi:hypothetical protein
VAVAPVLDDRGAVADADESGASVSVHHGLVRLKDARSAELQLQKFRACDRVQTERVHAGPGSAALSGVLLAVSRLRTSVRDLSGSAHGRLTRAIQQRNLWAAEMALRELGQPALEDALAYLDLLAEQKPEKLERAAVRWHGRLETETAHLTLAESQLALAALASLCAGERDAVQVLHRLLRRVRPTLVPRAGAG